VLSLAEELLLLAYHEEKGTVLMSASSKLDFCLAGAFLMELVLFKRLKVTLKTLEVIDKKSTDQAYLNTLLNQVGASERLRPAKYWIRKLHKESKFRKKELLKTLVEKGILNQDERQVFWFFTRKCFPLRDNRPVKEIQEHLHSVILRRENPDPRTEMLISLVWACDLTARLFKREERRYARKQIKEIAKFNPIAQGISKVIQESNSAVTTFSL
jgi:hypothetical protein